MAQPGRGDVHVDRPLTNFSLQYAQSMERFVAFKACTPVKVVKESDKYFIFTKADWLRDEGVNMIRSPGAEYARSGYAVTTGSYACDEYGLEKPIDDRIRANSDEPLNPDRNAVQWLNLKMAIRAERKWATDFFASSKWGTDKTVTNKWSDYGASTPGADVDVGIETIVKNTGIRPNTLIVGELTHKRLKRHPTVLDYYRYSAPIGDGGASVMQLAAFFELENYWVAEAVYNSAQEGQSFSGAYIVDDDSALLCYVDPSAGIEGVTAMKTFFTVGVSEGGVLAPQIYRYREDKINSDIIRASCIFDQVLVASDLGYFFPDVTD